eukprot:TRINITY_DN14231_c0_g1_i1.p1 TRINITY_DN14231_c0_g1~~TRINITY_DN14231_c0_g1_i1.p1  ORF type:complete len:1121 (+),score=331.87 TRINITY_DN14231_c0_g1_i1:475-3837(+)
MQMEDRLLDGWNCGPWKGLAFESMQDVIHAAFIASPTGLVSLDQAYAFVERHGYVRSKLGELVEKGHSSIHWKSGVRGCLYSKKAIFSLVDADAKVWVLTDTYRRRHPAVWGRIDEIRKRIEEERREIEKSQQGVMQAWIESGGTGPPPTFQTPHGPADDGRKKETKKTKKKQSSSKASEKPIRTVAADIQIGRYRRMHMVGMDVDDEMAGATKDDGSSGGIDISGLPPIMDTARKEIMHHAHEVPLPGGKTRRSYVVDSKEYEREDIRSSQGWSPSSGSSREISAGKMSPDWGIRSSSQGVSGSGLGTPFGSAFGPPTSHSAFSSPALKPGMGTPGMPMTQQYPSPHLSSQHGLGTSSSSPFFRSVPSSIVQNIPGTHTPSFYTPGILSQSPLHPCMTPPKKRGKFGNSIGGTPPLEPIQSMMPPPLELNRGTESLFEKPKQMEKGERSLYHREDDSALDSSERERTVVEKSEECSRGSVRGGGGGGGGGDGNGTSTSGPGVVGKATSTSAQTALEVSTHSQKPPLASTSRRSAWTASSPSVIRPLPVGATPPMGIQARKNYLVSVLRDQFAMKDSELSRTKEWGPLVFRSDKVEDALMTLTDGERDALLSYLPSRKLEVELLEVRKTVPLFVRMVREGYFADDSRYDFWRGARVSTPTSELAESGWDKRFSDDFIPFRWRQEYFSRDVVYPCPMQFQRTDDIDISKVTSSAPVVLSLTVPALSPNGSAKGPISQSGRRISVGEVSDDGTPHSSKSIRAHSSSSEKDSDPLLSESDGIEGDYDISDDGRSEECGDSPPHLGHDVDIEEVKQETATASQDRESNPHEDTTSPEHHLRRSARVRTRNDRERDERDERDGTLMLKEGDAYMIGDADADSIAMSGEIHSGDGEVEEESSYSSPSKRRKKPLKDGTTRKIDKTSKFSEEVDGLVQEDVIMIHGVHITHHSPSTIRVEVKSRSGETHNVEISLPSGKLGRPLGLGTTLTILCLGRICLREGFHNDRYIWPVGFRSMRLYYGIHDPEQKTEYISEIKDGGARVGPRFHVTLREDPSFSFVNTTPTRVWTEVVSAVNAHRSAKGKRVYTTVSGPEMFGLSNMVVSKLILSLPDADQCKEYRFRERKR